YVDLLFFGYLEFIQRGNKVFRGGVPIGIGNAKTVVRRLHVAAGVNTGATGRSAKLVQYVLANALLRILAMADKELFKALISDQPANEIINHGGQRIVSADPLVKRFFTLRLQPAMGRCGRRQTKRECEN